MSIKTTLSTGLVAVLSLAPGAHWGCEALDGPLGGSQPDDQPPAVVFETPADGAVITQPLRYGSVQVQAWDPDSGTSNGDGIRSVSMVVTDVVSGQVVAARSEFWPTYDFGPGLPDGVYTLAATAHPDWRSGRATTTASITITVDVDGTAVTPPTPVPTNTAVVPATPVPPTPAPTGTSVPPTPTPAPPTPAPTSTAVPVTPVPATPVPTSTPVPATPVPATPAPTSTTAPPTPVPATPAPTSTTAPPTPVPTSTAVPATPVPTPAGSASDAVSASLNALNQVRANAGLPPLTLNASMSSFALDWSQTMSQSGFRHSSGPYGENIAWYSDSSLAPQAAAAFFNEGWVNSPGHYRNMINAGYTEIGIGLYQDAGGWWATHVFR